MPSASLRPPSSAAATKRAANLQLSGLPRFHPANYPTSTRVTTSSSSSIISSASTSSSTSASPPSGTTSPSSQPVFSSSSGGLTRPQYHSRQYSDAQRKLHAYQREVMTRNYYGTPFTQTNPRPLTPTSPSAMDLRESPRSPRSPRSPQLHPLGSPGPVTPFELEGEQEGYLFSNTTDPKQLNEEAKEQILESYIQKERLLLASGGPTSHATQARIQQYGASSSNLRRGDPASHRSALSR